MCKFENDVKNNLIKCGITLEKKMRLGAAVSGGADSISLLVSLSSILSELDIPLFVITVNHNIRLAEESDGDANYVEEMCRKLRQDGLKVECDVVKLKKGEVAEVSRQRSGGIEEAARALRYQAFESFIKEKNLDALCLAHNKNDQLETLLMRFLQGSSCDSSGGIKPTRGKFVRPLLNIERCEIEKYLNEKKIAWRTDCTNFETEYFRNKIRLKLVPFLDKEFPCWQKAVLSGGEKSVEDSDAINQMISIILKNYKQCEISLSDFVELPESVKIRVLLKACNDAGETKRIPYVFLKDVINSVSENKKNRKSGCFIKQFSSIKIEVKNGTISVKKLSKSDTDSNFFVIIDEACLKDNCEIELPFVKFDVLQLKALGVTSPFCLRSVRIGDQIKSADGKMKNVSDILSDWHVSNEDREKVVVLQELSGSIQPIKCIFACFLGYKDWIVKL